MKNSREHEPLLRSLVLVGTLPKMFGTSKLKRNLWSDRSKSFLNLDIPGDLPENFLNRHRLCTARFLTLFELTLLTDLANLSEFNCL